MFSGEPLSRNCAKNMKNKQINRRLHLVIQIGFWRYYQSWSALEYLIKDFKSCTCDDLQGWMQTDFWMEMFSQDQGLAASQLALAWSQ